MKATGAVHKLHCTTRGGRGLATIVKVHVRRYFNCGHKFIKQQSYDAYTEVVKFTKGGWMPLTSNLVFNK